MPKLKYKFAGPNWVTEKILTREDATVGVIRIKPSSVLWKPSGAKKYYSVSLDDFIEWIEDPGTGATRVGG